VKLVSESKTADGLFIVDREAFDADDLILHPRSFEPTSRGPSWLGIDSCIWKGPENLLDETPLAIVSLYRANRKIAQLFHSILGIQNADFGHYERALSKLKAKPTVDIAERVSKLYKLFAGTHTGEKEWDTVRQVTLSSKFRRICS
jgi:hypothetical protein